MIGQTVERLRTGRNAWLAWMFVAVAVAIAAVALDNGHLTRFALAPTAVGLALLLSRKSKFLAHLEEDGIQISLPKPDFIPYRRLLTILRHRRGKDDYSFAFDVVHSNGTLLIPRDLNVPSIEIFDFLVSQVPDEDDIEPPPALRSFQVAQEKEFGTERVSIYRAIPLASNPPNWFWIFFCFFLFMSSIVWIMSGATDNRYHDWTMIGLITFLVSLIGLFVAIHRSSSQRRTSRIGVGGLVIGPIGFALQKSEFARQDALG